MNKKSCAWASNPIETLEYHKNCEDATENPLTCDFFWVLHAMKMLVVLHARREGWKDLMMIKTSISEASDNENISSIAPG
ncbi:MAG: hypothetical protein F6K40_19400 [Okeania sp. SIO3I5]|uniref:hypothetical protein n=1 Tax=Okeania sp. SIO3I5 TaxID=2607805 RepID=UPI0013BB2B38|nr:hypothetical protein [Okeania sp. SIO3I5]NEQ38311.1 hypothetical protein [Okeania sp. SIO3I5]